MTTIMTVVKKYIDKKVNTLHILFLILLTIQSIFFYQINVKITQYVEVKKRSLNTYSNLKKSTVEIPEESFNLFKIRLKNGYVCKYYNKDINTTKQFYYTVCEKIKR